MKKLIITGLATLLPLESLAEPTGWFLRAYGGYSQLSDIDADASGIVGSDVAADISLDGGFTAGAGAGYRFDRRWAVEAAWEYRSNDSETNLGGLAAFPDGNLASNTFWLNGYYHFAGNGKWDPYAGLGLGWLQEVDLDLEGDGPERSYSGDGDIGFQVFLGANYALAERWFLQGEVRYASFTDLELEGESGAAGELSSLDYEPLTLQLGVIYRF